MPFGIPSEDFHGGFGLYDEDEEMNWQKVLGIVFILGSVMIVNLKPSRAKES